MHAAILLVALLPAGLEPTRAGTVLLVEGVGGWGLFRFAGGLGFRLAGLHHEVRQFHWGHGPGRFLLDLRDRSHVEAKGAELAVLVLALKREAPDRPVYLVAHSGGTGVAACAAALLPPDCLERVILLSSALSPDYDLRPALAACRRGIVSYHAPSDFLILGWGTRTFGTIDRVHVATAGCTGFRLPPGVGEDDPLYRRLIQAPWNARMALRGNLGTHNGTVMPSFLATDVARWLR